MSKATALPAGLEERTSVALIGPVLDLPVAPSVNRTRRINWAAKKIVADWVRAADNLLRAARYRPSNVERFEIHVIFSEAHTEADLDNPIKMTIDYLRRIEAIKDDNKKRLRKLVVEWDDAPGADAPEGCRITIVPLPG